LGVFERRLAFYGSESPRVTNTIEVVDGDGEVFLLELVGSLKVELQSSLKKRIRIRGLRE
jgi:hypothetical protein